MRKIIIVLAVAMLCISFSSCANKIGLKNEATTTFEDNVYTTTPPKKTLKNTANNIEELNRIVEKDVEDTISALNAEYEHLKSDVDTYNKYLKNVNRMESFYIKICETHKNLCIRMREYSIDYVDLIISSGKSNYDMYNDLDELYDNIYDYASDDIYDGVYGGLLDDMYDDYYSGILDIDYDDIDDYKEWSNVLSNEYDLWSDTCSDVYDDWSDFSSDVYGFWSDIGSAIYKDDMERVEKKIEKFQKDIDELR